MNWAIFFDRDDTLIRNVPYLGDPDQVELLPGAIECVHMLRDAGARLILVSNQSGVGRGLITKEQVVAVNTRMVQLLGIGDLDAEYLCYASPEDPYGAEERKPSPLMLQRAAEEHALDLSSSFMVGDKWIDVECGHRAGCLSVLVTTGTDSQHHQRAQAEADYVAGDLNVAAEWILRTHREKTA